MTKHRVAIIGCGAMAQGSHLPHCQSNSRVELAAVCDLNRDTAEKCRKQFGAGRAETDWRKVISADDIDVCILATHHAFRGEFIIPALEAGKAVYTEKPLAPSRSEMAAIAAAARRTGRPVCVGHNRRSSKAIREFKRLLDKARTTRHALPPSISREVNRQPLPEESALQLLIRVNDDIRSWKSWGYTDQEGILFSEMVHFIDLALWLNASRLVRIFAEGSCRGNFTLALRFADGSITTMHHTMVGHFDYPKELFEATTRNVSISFDHYVEVRQVGLPDEPVQQFYPLTQEASWATGRGMQGYMDTLQSEVNRVKESGGSIRWQQVGKGHEAHLNRFLDHLENSGENPCDIESAVAVNLVALKLVESIRLGMPLPVHPEDWHIAV